MVRPPNGCHVAHAIGLNRAPICRRLDSLDTEDVIGLEQVCILCLGCDPVRWGSNGTLVVALHTEMGRNAVSGFQFDVDQSWLRSKAQQRSYLEVRIRVERV